MKKNVMSRKEQTRDNAPYITRFVKGSIYSGTRKCITQHKNDIVPIEFEEVRRRKRLMNVENTPAQMEGMFEKYKKSKKSWKLLRIPKYPTAH